MEELVKFIISAKCDKARGIETRYKIIYLQMYESKMQLNKLYLNLGCALLNIASFVIHEFMNHNFLYFKERLTREILPSGHKIQIKSTLLYFIIRASPCTIFLWIFSVENQMWLKQTQSKEAGKERIKARKGNEPISVVYDNEIQRCSCSVLGI